MISENKKELNKNFIRIANIRKKQNKSINRFNYIDFRHFFFKFLGIFIYRGKRSEASKILDFFLLNLKKSFKLNPYKILFKIIKNLIPFLVTGLKTHKGRVFYVPIMVKGNKRNVLVIDWLVRLFKNYSNTWGIKKEDILKSLIDSFNLKGTAINMKKDQYNKALENKYNLKRKGYQKYLIKLYTKYNKKVREKKYIKRRFKRLQESVQWKWKTFYLKKRKYILNWRLYYYKQRNYNEGINFKKLLVK